MKPNALGLTVLALLSVALLTFTSCSSAPKGEASTAAVYQEGVPGGVFVQTFKTTATVTAIDAASRKVTLVSPDGKKTTVKAGPNAVNFNQIRIGDQVTATVTEELVVSLAEAGAAANDGAAKLVALSPVGAKPGLLMADTVQVTTKVKAIDLKHHKATLEFPDGSTRTVAVRPDVDLTRRKVGETVVIRSTEAFAILVEKP